MAMNPMMLMKLKERLNIFRREHPKVSPFIHSIREEGLEPGSILELKVKKKEGRESALNIRLTDNDVETIQMIHKSR